MRACVVFLTQFAGTQETQRRLFELRILMGDVSDVPLDSLPWTSVRLDRSNSRWRTLYDLSKFLLVKDWQDTRSDTNTLKNSISLLYERIV